MRTADNILASGFKAVLLCFLPRTGKWQRSLALAGWLLAGGIAWGTDAQYKVLLFTKTAAFRHASIPDGIAAIQALGSTNHFTVDATEDATVFATNSLAQYRAVIFLSTTGDILNDNQQAAFENYIRSGGGWVGIHAASDTEYGWPWYASLVGAYFQGHPSIQPATIKVADPHHPSTVSLPQRWSRTDEWYNFQSNPRGKVHVLATLDERSYSGGGMGYDHPIIWCHDYDGGRVWYTAGGHTSESYSEPLFLMHLLGGIEYAAGIRPGDGGATIENNFQKVVLDSGLTAPMQLAVAADGRVFYILRNGQVRVYRPQTSSAAALGQISVYTGDEDGLLGLALDPGFATNNWLYLFYSTTTNSQQNLSRFTVLGEALDLTSEKLIFTVPTQRGGVNHAAGALAFGPDGNLYLATGDNTNPFSSDGYAPLDERAGRERYDAQRSAGNANDLRGKILRLRPQPGGSYTIPAGNLFPVDGSGGRPEIYVMGCRNPFRISVDPENGWLYWGDVGPDSHTASVTRGPLGYDEINQARAAGNFGWPYFSADNKPYVAYNFGTSQSGAAFNPNAPVNNSPNNTGPVNLPPARPAMIWYAYDSIPEFPEMGLGTYRTAMAGPVYQHRASLVSNRQFPRYYDKTLFFVDWARSRMYEAKLDSSGTLLKINPFLPSLRNGLSVFNQPISMAFGPDGALYYLEYKAETLSNTGTLSRIDYGAGNQAPVAQAAASPANGAVPLTVQFSSGGTFDPEGDALSYAWSFLGDGVTNSTAPNASHTYTQAGVFTPRLTVTDARGNTAVVNFQIVAGNAAPAVNIQDPPNGAFFDWGDFVHYQVTVSDLEDGSTTNQAILPSNVTIQPFLGHGNHAHPLSIQGGLQGLFPAPELTGPDSDDLYLLVEASYTDRGAPGTVPLTGRTTHTLHPRRKQAEHFMLRSGVTALATLDPAGGGLDIVDIDHGDYLVLSPANLLNITSIVCRVASNFGGRIEVHGGSADGPLACLVTVPPTGGAYSNVTATVTARAVTEDLYLMFLRNPGDAGLFVLNWVEFNGPGASLKPVVVESSVPVAGPFTNAVGTSLDLFLRTLVVAPTNQFQFYLLRSSLPRRFKTHYFDGTNIVFTYE